MTRSDYYKEIEATSLAIRAEISDAQAILDTYEGKPSGERLTLRLARLTAENERACAERARREKKVEEAARAAVEAIENDAALRTYRMGLGASEWDAVLSEDVGAALRVLRAVLAGEA